MGQEPVRAAEVIGAMSIATDLGTGQPLEHALRTAILAVRLGELAELSSPELVDAYYISLLHSFGCTSDATEQTELFGDDIEPRAKFALVDGGNPEELAAFLKDVVGQGRPPEVREAMVAHALENALEIARSTFALHCEVAQRFAGWLGFGPGVISNLAYAFERWDGNGFPGAAAWRLGLPEHEVTMVRRAALALDLGRVAVSNAIWEKPGPFGLTDWERVQLHPYFTERSFAHAPALASIGELAGAHHERLDGAGYHRKTLAPALGRAARILAAADCYQAMRERRPHRPALDALDAETELLRDASSGRLCPEAVDAVLAAAGHRVAKRPRELPAGLTDRELEVLLALAGGKTNKEIAESLGISAKTAGHHVQHTLDKPGARTRTAATGRA